MSKYLFLFLAIAILSSCKQQSAPADESTKTFYAEKDGNSIYVFEKGQSKPVVTQNAAPDFRPYLHPILAPGSEAELTQYSPGHHKHQTGLYWGFTRVNGTGIEPDSLSKWFYRPDKPEAIRQQIGRDFFHHPEGTHWQRKSLDLLIDEGSQLKWQTVYNMLDEQGQPILEETQIWTFSESNGHHLLELEWKGKALTDITINEFDYGGLFLRMPWHEGIEGEVINAARQRNEKAEGQRAQWVDVGMAIEGLDEWGHIAIFDHPDNDGFPQTWRVDGQLGVGPVRARQGDWQIKAGETATFRHQIVAYEGELSDISLNKLWGDFIGDQGMYNGTALWGLAQEEGYSAKFLTPEEAIAEMTIKEGYTVNAFAAEPMITQPMAFCWDDRGRMWIAENRDYESRGSGFSNSGDSRILILEDTDRDGVADKKTVFLENIPFPSAIAVGFDGLYLGAPPNLLFVPDKNHDDRADEADIEVLLTGWGIRDRHETINSFHWGPDGWLYGLEGFATPSVIRKPTGKGKIYRAGEPFPENLLDADGVDINGGVWRYHPTKKRFEVVAHGFSNPWGIDYDAKGQLFISACVIPHMFHVIPGGIYHRQGGRHFNPYVYKDIQTIVDHRHRSAHGGARIYQSDAFPEEQRGRLFMANIHEHAVLSDILQPNGSGFTASHGEDFMLANNAQWIGFSMEIGPEGGLYVLDWHDADICGKEVKHKETGRVFRITPENSRAENWSGRYDDLITFSDEQLVALQWQGSDWHARRARVILQFRASKGALSSEATHELSDHFNNDTNADYRLRALWALYITGNISEDLLISSLDDRDPYVRAWAIQFLCEDKTADRKSLLRMTELARKEQSPVVRLYLAKALQRIDAESRWALAENLVTYADDADDPNIPFMLWFGIESLVPEQAERALALAGKSKIPMVTNHIARRLVDAGELEPLTAALSRKSANRQQLLEGMLAGLEGRVDIDAPKNWEKVYQGLSADKVSAATALRISQYFGNAAAAEAMLASLKDPKAGNDQKENAITVLAAQQRPELPAELPRLLEVPELRIPVIRAVASYDRRDLGTLLLDKYSQLPLDAKQEAILALSSRPVYGRLLADAIKNEKIAKKEIPPYVALQLRRVVGNGFVEIWGPIDELSSDKRSEYAKYQRLLQPGAIAQSDPVQGKGVYLRTCGACHKMYGEGGNLGPDLTGSNRTNTAYLLGNILEPSSEIQDDYKMVVITTQDGRTFSGNIVAENDQQLTMRVVGQDEIQISQSNIQSREVTPKSMMPEGLLQYLTDKEILDLVAFLQTKEPIVEMD
ncbi:PVC-type heme-binding CxxCH protein [Flavilitoribacter nigricans]|uniref:Dehydrogenase n=1 Tax=Flavilitoribacter nigricans (strain ATCC 23147 / DSM 23189 / NBRC 102662 / NCIMB 1420 / SS-2) TaxID=1122177 RepID=A0A2D0NBW3_FLAN2|nr:PVC-type heme-binding CxxCH protein [Flavilitoribacter nigricans]PHN05994.1 dehydrogenase [Flavilitoribacter nigricans DSM 23189 = NBRC 102662]